MRQYLFFFINGCVLGMFAWALQIQLYKLMGSGGLVAYAVATALTYAPLIVANCMIQRYLIFRMHGLFIRFLLSSLFIMVLVSLVSPAFKQLIDLVLGVPFGEQGGFAVAAVLGSIPSFLLNKFWVFRGCEKEE